MKNIGNYFQTIKTSQISHQVMNQPAPTKMRVLLGLPDLNDTDNNSIRMHNLHIENEVYHINKHMGSSENREDEKSLSSMAEMGIDSRFGF